MKPKLLINIQLLRLVAAAWVLLYHTAMRLPTADSELGGLYRLGEAIGFAGVDIFFVLSGFIMAHATIQHSGVSDSAHFLGRRLARIYSGYWPFFALTLLVFSWTRARHVEQAQLLESFFLWPIPLSRNLLEISWTLSYELYFYALFGLIISAVPCPSRARLLQVITTCLLITMIYRHALLGAFRPENIYFVPFATQFLLSPFLIEFFAGAALAYGLQNTSGEKAWIWLMLGIATFLSGAVMNHSVYDGHIEQGFHVLPRVIWFGTAALFLITGLVKLEHAGVTAPRRLSVRGGGASYAIYLSHIPLLEVTRQLGLNTALAAFSPTLIAFVYALVMLVIIALSCLHYELIERRLLRVFRRALRV